MIRQYGQPDDGRDQHQFDGKRAKAPLNSSSLNPNTPDFVSGDLSLEYLSQKNNHISCLVLEIEQCARGKTSSTDFRYHLNQLNRDEILALVPMFSIILDRASNPVPATLLDCAAEFLRIAEGLNAEERVLPFRKLWSRCHITCNSMIQEAEVHFSIGDKSQFEGRYQDAFRSYNLGFEILTDKGGQLGIFALERLVKFARICADVGDNIKFDDCLEKFNSLIAFIPEPSDRLTKPIFKIRLQFAELLERLDLRRSAAQQYQSILNDMHTSPYYYDPKKEALIYYLKGYCLLSLNAHQDALDCFNKALTSIEDSPKISRSRIIGILEAKLEALTFLSYSDEVTETSIRLHQLKWPRGRPRDFN